MTNDELFAHWAKEVPEERAWKSVDDVVWDPNCLAQPLEVGPFRRAVHYDDYFAETKDSPITALIDGLLAELPEDEREAFVGVALENLSFRDMAPRLGITDKTVKVRFIAAAAKLRTALTSRPELLALVRHRLPDARPAHVAGAGQLASFDQLLGRLADLQGDDDE